MAYTVDSLVRIAFTGASLTVSSNYTVDSLVRIADSIKGRGGILTIANCKLTVDSMVRVSSSAPGQVHFTDL